MLRRPLASHPLGLTRTSKVFKNGHIPYRFQQPPSRARAGVPLVSSPEKSYPRFLQELLESCPAAGSGVHLWLFRVARYLHHYHEPEAIADILQKCVVDCGRDLEQHEIPDAVNNSMACAWHPEGKKMSERRAEWNAKPTMRVCRIPDFDPNLTKRTAARVPVDITPDWLKAQSPVPVSCSTEQFLQTFFQPNEKALVFNVYKSQGRLWPELPIGRFSQIHWVDGCWFLCNPVDGLDHFNPRLAKKSRRSQESVTTWRYAVLECDHEPKAKWLPIWLKILVQLPLPVVSLTDSAGKSVHALVRVSCDSKAAWDAFKTERLLPLVKIGACPGSLSAVRLTRLPNTYRGDRLQELLYLNPGADGTPIFQNRRSPR